MTSRLIKAARAAATVLIAAATAIPSAVLASDKPGCMMTVADAAWLSQALRHWRIAERRYLHLAQRPLPLILIADGECTYSARAGLPDPSRLRGTPHGGTVTFPDGGTQPIGTFSFSRGEPGGGYFAMSLPSVWEQAGVKSDLGVEGLMNGVMLHELMHMRQLYFVTPLMAALTAQYHLPDDIDDDALQHHFEHDPDYRAAYEHERDLLFRAAAAPSTEEARRFARLALDALRARRARWFVGSDQQWAPLDDLFLMLEGLGQWVAYAWYVDPRGRGLQKDFALRNVRRGGKYWTQDEGLALFLVVDRLLPGWQQLAFARKPLLAEALLEKAVGPANAR